MRHNNIDNESIKEPKTDNRPLTIMDSAITITFWIIAGITLVYMSFTASKHYDNLPGHDTKTQDNKELRP